MYDLVIVVPGASDSKRYIRRIAGALSLYYEETSKGKNCLVLVSGYDYRTTPVGKVIERYAMKGINIFPEPNSRTTEENALLSYSIIKNLNLKDKEVWVITESSHLPRTKLIFERVFKDYNLKFYQVPDAESLLKRLPYELIGFLYGFLPKELKEKIVRRFRG